MQWQRRLNVMPVIVRDQNAETIPVLGLASPSVFAHRPTIDPPSLQMQYYYANCFTINCGFRLDKTNYKP